MDLAEIQQAIEQFLKDQQAVLAARLAERDQAEWESEAAPSAFVRRKWRAPSPAVRAGVRKFHRGVP